MSASLGSTQTVQVRVAAATLQAAATIPEAERDGSEQSKLLQQTSRSSAYLSLLQSDVPDYLTGLIRSRYGIDSTARIGRRSSLPASAPTRSLRRSKSSTAVLVWKERQEAIDICLASNIIEVGVDIDRLGLMTIVGQPKTTAQYIQVTGRVGRKWEVAPDWCDNLRRSKPRDRSHFERFRTYHHQLYAQVEPTSVTPFATPVLRRALHAVAVSYVRQNSPMTIGPDPFPRTAYQEAIDLLRDRAVIAEPDEVPMLEHIARDRAARVE